MTDDFELDFELGKEDSKEVDECKGIFFRCSINDYWDRDRGQFTYQTRLRLLKRKSCPGCEKCGSFYEDLDQAGLDAIEIEENKLEHGEIYTAVFVPGCPDWETGILDNWSWRIEPSSNP